MRRDLEIHSNLERGGKGHMMNLILLRRWTVRALGLLVLVAAIVLGGAASAQSPPSAQLPKMTYSKKTEFHLPVQMEERTRVNLREVCLYVKTGSGDWVRQETGVPSISHFTYKVPRDGEYWFSLVTIDKAGRMTPPDVSQDAPGLRVMVDTQAPVIDVQPWTNPDGDFCIRCQVQDANPDPQSLKNGGRHSANDQECRAEGGSGIGFIRSAGTGTEPADGCVKNRGSKTLISTRAAHARKKPRHGAPDALGSEPGSQ
jgi:hypothetical protein